jgi:hypothetical protein
METVMTTSGTRQAAASGTFLIAGETPVHRLGFGAMRITGAGIWGPPADHDGAVRVLRRGARPRPSSRSPGCCAAPR